MAQIATLALLLLALAAPFVLVWQWVRQFGNRESTASGARSVFTWAALITATLAVGAFWLCTATMPRFGSPERDAHITKFIWFSFGAAGLAVLSALSGKGRARWWIVLSAIAAPAGWFVYAVMQ